MKIKKMLKLVLVMAFLSIDIFCMSGGADLKPRRIAMYFDFHKSEMPGIKKSQNAIATLFAINIYQEASICIVDESVLLKFVSLKDPLDEDSFIVCDDDTFDLNKWFIYFVPKTSLYVFIPKIQHGIRFNPREAFWEDVFKIDSWFLINASTRKDLHKELHREISKRESINPAKDDFFKKIYSKKSRSDYYDLNNIFITNKDLYAKNSPLLDRYKKETGEIFKGSILKNGNIIKQFFRPLNIVIFGHGGPHYKLGQGDSSVTVEGALAGLSVPIFTEVVKFLDVLNTQFLLIFSCSAGGKNLQHILPLNLTYPVVFSSISDSAIMTPLTKNLSQKIDDSVNIGSFFSTLEDDAEPIQIFLKKELSEYIIDFLDKGRLDKINELLSFRWIRKFAKEPELDFLIDSLVLDVASCLKSKLLKNTRKFVAAAIKTADFKTCLSRYQEEIRADLLGSFFSEKDSIFIEKTIQQWIDQSVDDKDYSFIFNIFLNKKIKLFKKNIENWLSFHNKLPFYPALNYLTLCKDWFFRQGGMNAIPQILLPRSGWVDVLEIDPRIAFLSNVWAKISHYEGKKDLLKQKLVLIVEPDILTQPLRIKPVREKRALWLDSLKIKTLWDIKYSLIDGNKESYLYYPKIIPRGISDVCFFKEIELIGFKFKNSDEETAGICHFLRDAFLSMQELTVKKFFYIKKLTGFNDFYSIYDAKNMFKDPIWSFCEWVKQIKSYGIDKPLEFTDVYLEIDPDDSKFKITFKWNDVFWVNTILVKDCLFFLSKDTEFGRSLIDDQIGQEGYDKFQELLELDASKKQLPGLKIASGANE